MTGSAKPRLRETLRIERLGQRGEGMAVGRQGSVYVAYAVPGDTIVADVEGERGTLVGIAEPAPDRIAPFCPYFGACGGCAVQTLAPASYAAWKRSLVSTALARAGVAADVSPLVDAHGEGRRRATFHARLTGLGARRKIAVGFMQARTHDIVEIDGCPILAPSMAGALPAARALAEALAGLDKPLDIVATATLSGLDLDVRGCGTLAQPDLRRAMQVAEKHDLARLSNHGEVILERRAPLLRLGRASLVPPPGAFLQATRAGEEHLSRLVTEAVARARVVADLFCGVGTFALPLAERADVHAVETDKAALDALLKAARGTAGLRPVTSEARNLFTRPLMRTECDRFEAIVFDPPRAGAEAQARELASAATPSVVAVSCNAVSFARDAKVLVDGGYTVDRITPIDQFRHSAHVEIVGVFRRVQQKVRRRRSLLG